MTTEKYFCNKCGYYGPVQYPHQRFQEVETEFCRYYAAPAPDPTPEERKQIAERYDLD